MVVPAAPREPAEDEPAGDEPAALPAPVELGVAAPGAAETLDAVVRTKPPGVGAVALGVGTGDGTLVTGVDTFGVVTDGVVTLGAVTVGAVTLGVVTVGVVTFGVVTVGVVTFGAVSVGSSPWVGDWAWSPWGW